MPRVMVIAALLLGVMAGYFNVSIAYAESEEKSGRRLLTIHDQGIEKGILTEKSTLREALQEARIHIDPNDITEPALDEKLVSSQYQVNIYRARPVVIVDGVVRTKVMSPYRTASQIVNQAGLKLQDEDKADLSRPDDILLDGPVETLTIDRAIPFIFVFYGKRIESYTQASTVGEMLKLKSITPKKDDTVSVPLTAPIVANMTVELWHNGKQTLTQEEDIDFPIEKIKDANREAGFRDVQTPGIKGKKDVTYEIVMKNGKEESRTVINSVTTKEPVKQVEIVGAKFNYTGGPLNEAQITALGMCESGMTATRNSGNGFYGAFQFMPSTWSRVAPAPYNSVLPHEAPLDAQKQAVQSLLSRSSIYTQFPGCARKMQASGVL